MTSQVEVNDNVALIQGDLLFNTVVGVRTELEQAMLASKQNALASPDLGAAFTLDFSRVLNVDSSALSLWLCLQRFAGRYKVQLIAINVPAELSSIARLVGLDKNGLNNET